MFNLEVDGETWRYAFTRPDGILSSEDRDKLLVETIRLHKTGDKLRDIKGDEFEGRISKGKYFTLGICAGTEYIAELDTNKGKKHASILVHRILDSSLN